MQRLVWVLVSAVGLGAACSTGDELFGGDNGPTSGSGASSSSSKAATSSVSAGGESATSTVVTSSTAETSSPASSTASTGGGVVREIPCTNETCVGGDICCVHLQNPQLDQCGPPGQCGEGYVEVGCNGPKDCEMNEVCCGHFNMNEGYQLIECAASCPSTSTDFGIIMCGDDPSACGPMQQCFQSGFLPSGHSYCQ